MGVLLKKEDWLLVTIFILASATTISKAYFTSHGYLTSDAIAYLAVAQNLIEGNGIIRGKGDFFAKWPVGYPILIFAVAKLTGLTVFWASKVLNIFLIGGILSLFRSLFKDNAFLYGLIFFFSAYLEIYSYSWSEPLFIFALVFFAHNIYIIIDNQKNSFAMFVLLASSSLILSFTRYIGAFSFIIVGLLGLYFLFFKRDKIQAAILISIALITTIIMVGYLYFNYLETGYPTGIPRTPASESNFQLLIMLLKAVMAEVTISIHRFGSASLVAFSVQFSIIAILIWKYSRHFKKTMVSRQKITLTIIFIVIGFTYLFSIILLRWLSQFDPYSFRLLAPGTFMLLIALATYIIEISSIKGKNIFLSTMLLFSLSSLALFGPIRTFIKYDQDIGTYNTYQKNILNKYSGVKQNSIIIFGTFNLAYLRTDLDLHVPSYQEEWPKFLDRIDPEHKRPIYMEIPKKVDSKEYHRTFISFFEAYAAGTLVEIQ
jgi:hypothetical protein